MMVSRNKIVGISIVLFGIAFATFFALEMLRSELGFEDADNPAVSIALLRQHPDVFIFTGVASVFMAITLAIAVLSTVDLWEKLKPYLTFRVATLFGIFSAAFFFMQGILRIQSPGTLLHMDNLNHEWGLAGYLAVQMAGTQGFGSSGGFALSIWIIGISIMGFIHRTHPRFLSFLGVLPFLFLIIGIFGPLISLPDSIYLLYIISIFGQLIWCAVFGIVMLMSRPDS